MGGIEDVIGNVIGSLVEALPELMEAAGEKVSDEIVREALLHNSAGIRYNNEGKFAQAREEFSLAILKIGEDSSLKPNMLFNLGFTCTALNDFKDAKKWLEQALGYKKIPEDLEYKILKELAFCEHSQQSYLEEHKIWTKIIKQFPNHPEIYKIYGDLVVVSFLLDQENEARLWFDKAVLLKAVDPAYIANIGFTAGIIIYAKGGYEQAFRYFKDALAIQSNFQNAHQALLGAGHCCKKLHRPEEAQTFFDQSVLCPTANPEFIGEIHYEFGVEDYNQKKLDEALAHFFKAIEAQPQHPKLHLIYYYLGEISRMQGKLDDALNYYQKIQGCPAADNLIKSRAQMATGSVYLLSGRYQEAYDIYKKEIDLHLDDPAIFVIYQNIGTASTYLKHYDETKLWYKRAIAHPNCDDATRKTLQDWLDRYSY